MQNKTLNKTETTKFKQKAEHKITWLFSAKKWVGFTCQGRPLQNKYAITHHSNLTIYTHILSPAMTFKY